VSPLEVHQPDSFTMRHQPISLNLRHAFFTGADHWSGPVAKRRGPYTAEGHHGGYHEGEGSIPLVSKGRGGLPWRIS
jgi:hypothetical protein